MIGKEQLKSMQAVDITKVDRSTLVDVTAQDVDPTAPLHQRFSQIIDQVKNPFAFRVGDYAVKIEYTQDGPSLSDTLSGYLLALRAGY